MAEPTIFLFDGFNLLHAGGFRSPEELRDVLASWVAARGVRGVLVFDGHGPESVHGPLTVRWAEDADAAIERLAAEHRRRVQVAVVSSEDARFCSHNGVDWIEFGDVLDEATDGDGEGPTRGASTISMQTAKNLFLWDGRNPIRKVLELPLAYWMDLVWTKRHMIEVYLNIVEWAPGVYGAEAASRYHFNKPAAKLTKREAALLAAVLPNPIKRSAGKPSKRVTGIAGRIMARMNIMGPYVTCLGLRSPL